MTASLVRSEQQAHLPYPEQGATRGFVGAGRRFWQSYRGMRLGLPGQPCGTRAAVSAPVPCGSSGGYGGHTTDPRALAVVDRHRAAPGVVVLGLMGCVMPVGPVAVPARGGPMRLPRRLAVEGLGHLDYYAVQRGRLPLGTDLVAPARSPPRNRTG